MEDPTTKFDRAYILLTLAEFSNREDKFLHRNIGEKSYTLGGIYQHIHKDNEVMDWDFVDKLVKLCHQDFKRASVMLFHDTRIKAQVHAFFKANYWNPAKLDEVQSNIMAQEIFLMGVVAGVSTAVKLAQRLIGTTPDGIIGKKTIKALNIFDEKIFDKRYDALEENYFNSIIEHNPELEINRDGWYARANLV